jgi:predicted HD superfamily hydrolase involved in NAD metabolism
MNDRDSNYVSLETADTFTRSRLSDKRYDHTIRVTETAQRLVRIHNLDEDRTRLAALLHDAARETPSEELLRLARDWSVPVEEPELQSPNLLHGPVAAELARRELGVEDEEVLEAIRIHTTGAPRMGPLALAVYVADKIEPGRDYPSVERLRKLATEDLRETAAEALRRAIAHNEERGRPTHLASRETLAWLEDSQNSAQGGM